MGLEAGVAYYDLTNMRLVPGSGYYGALIVQPLSVGGLTLGVRVGVVLHPATRWTSPFGGAVVSKTWNNWLGASVSAGLAAVDPDTQSWGLYLSICAYFFILD